MVDLKFLFGGGTFIFGDWLGILNVALSFFGGPKSFPLVVGIFIKMLHYFPVLDLKCFFFIAIL